MNTVVSVFKDGSYVFESALDASVFSMNEPDWLVTIPLEGEKRK